MTPLQKIFVWAGLGIYGALLFLLFTFYRLPSDRLLEDLLTRFTETPVRVSAERASFSLPLSYEMERIVCFLSKSSLSFISCSTAACPATEKGIFASQETCAFPLT